MDNPIKGVDADIAAWKAFLSSAVGGGWTSGEIEDLSGWSRENLLDYCHSGVASDYSLVCFSGHGFVAKDDLDFDVTHLKLNDSEIVAEWELYPRGERGLMILDCCRMPRELSVWKMPLEESSSWDLESSRKMFNQCMMHCEKGVSTVYAVNVNQQAEDDPSFTRAMLDTAVQMASTALTAVVRVNEAVERVKGNMSLRKSPLYEGGRRVGHFPIAVNPHMARLLAEG